MKTRRHHNNRGDRQVRTGKTRTQVEKIAKRLKVTRSSVVDVPGHPVAAPCTITYCQFFDLERDSDDAYATLKRLDTILTQTANALNGEPGPLHLHSFHDLPEVAGTLRRALEVIYTMTRGDAQGNYWEIRKFLDDHGIYNANLSTAERLIAEVCKLVLK